MPNRPVRFSCARTAHSRRPANARQNSMFVVLPDTQDRHLIFLLAGPSSGTLLLGVHSGPQKTLWLRSFPGFAVLLLPLLCVVCPLLRGPHSSRGRSRTHALRELAIEGHSAALGLGFHPHTRDRRQIVFRNTSAIHIRVGLRLAGGLSGSGKYIGLG